MIVMLSPTIALAARSATIVFDELGCGPRVCKGKVNGDGKVKTFGSTEGRWWAG
jgi:hypothetical protein